jgi:hypothetical protein
MIHHASASPADWTAILKRLASDVGLQGYEEGTIALDMKQGPQIVIEPLEGATAVALHTDLGMAERDANEDEPFFANLLSANAPARGVDAPAFAVDPVSGSLVLFKRFQDARSLDYEEFVAHLHAFADAAKRDLATTRPAADLESETRPHDEVFARIWSDFLKARGLARDADDAQEMHTGGAIELDDGGYLLVDSEPATGTVLLQAVLAFLPLDELDDEPVFKRLLEAHLLGEATDLACFAIDPEDETLIAFRRLPVEGLDADKLGEALDGLGITAARFAEMLSIARPGAAVAMQ